jgi:putative tryptophan/tyrosine transport system substrate-binding protein
MQRRDFMTLVGGAATWPFAARAQQAKIPAQETGRSYRIGYLGSGSPATSERYAVGFRDALGRLGYVEGQNTVITYRWAAGKFDRLPVLLDELLRDKPDVIIGFGGTQVASAIKSATSTLPAVILSDDPVAEGLVENLARPGGNLTGVSILQEEAELKRVQLLKEALPHAVRIAVLRDPGRPHSGEQLDAVNRAASAIGLDVTTWDASNPDELGRILASVPVGRIDALLVLTDPMLFTQREVIVDFAAGNRLPGFYFWREFVEAGGLMSYGPNLGEMHRRMAFYVDKILKGAKPADLPIERPIRFELVINIKTAKALGLTISSGVLAIADEVIE